MRGIKKLVVLSVIAASFFSCHKTKEQAGCGTQVCTNVFAAIGVGFADINGNPITIKNFTAINQRTKQSVVPVSPVSGPAQPGYYIVTDDNSRKDFSTEGDEVIISGTHPTTNVTKTVTFKISGGCNCHVEKISGSSTVVFD
ncbi:hypothetical protein HK413_00215 [Mucilaginibacter sp. S1162]|uniref:Uncharacterized protein n=1 Tax=Mucilaginibacter humi TaxID=2732510 RepID=A0ABX1W410_9SPHI|nr:hypothetical protein [Mucilaginibacter humi]NNU33015.1 hypothetical protein [Mucilaginibacter humi]